MGMIRTAVNVSGDAMVSTVVAKSEGKLDIATYNNPNAGMSDTEEAAHLDNPDLSASGKV